MDIRIVAQDRMRSIELSNSYIHVVGMAIVAEAIIEQPIQLGLYDSNSEAIAALEQLHEECKKDTAIYYMP